MGSPESQNGHEHRRGSTWRDRKLERQAVQELVGWECGSWGRGKWVGKLGTSGGAVLGALEGGAVEGRPGAHLGTQETMALASQPQTLKLPELRM